MVSIGSHSDLQRQRYQMAELLLIGSGLVMAGGMIGGAYKYAKGKNKKKKSKKSSGSISDGGDRDGVNIVRAEDINERGFICLNKSPAHRQEAWERSKGMQGIHFVTYDQLPEVVNEKIASGEDVWKEIKLDDSHTHNRDGDDHDDDHSADHRGSNSTLDSNDILHYFPRWSIDDEDIRTSILNPKNNLCLYFANEHDIVDNPSYGAHSSSGNPINNHRECIYAGMIIGSTSRMFNDTTGICFKIDLIISLRGDPSLVLFPLNGYDFHDLRSALKIHFTIIEFCIDVKNEGEVIAFYEYNGFKRFGMTEDGKVNMKRVIEIE